MSTLPAIDTGAELLADGDKVIKVQEKLAHMSVNAGCEGTADFYLCELRSLEGELLNETILCIFIARFEEFTCKLVSKSPHLYKDAADACNRMLSAVEKHYIEFSKREKECLQTKVH